MNLVKLFVLFLICGSVQARDYSQLPRHVEEETLFRGSSSEPHDIQIINKGSAALEKRLRLIEKARESIDVEYFIYKDDKSGRLFTQALAKKAREGVRVRILIDHIATSSDITAFHAHEMRKSGIEIRHYNTAPLIQVSTVQYRTHRKIFLIDGKEGIIGGRNIGDDYFDLDERYNFLDRDLYFKGPLAANIKQIFNEFFNNEHSVELPRPPRPKMSDIKYRRGGRSQIARNLQIYKTDLRNWKVAVLKARAHMEETEVDEERSDKVAEIGGFYLENEYSGTCPRLSYASDRPGVGSVTLRRRIIRYEIFKRMAAVQNKLVIDSPYFVLNEDYANILGNLLDNGKIVDILTNGLSSTDAIYVAAVFNDTVGGWLKEGMLANVYRGFAPEGYAYVEPEVAHAGFGVHSKTMVFDNDSFFIGTYNFDPRSANYSAEIALFCDGNEDARNALVANIEYRKSNGVQLTSPGKVREQEFENVGFFKQVLYYMVKFPAHWFSHLL